MQIKNSYETYAIVTIAFWSLANVFTRLALRYFTAFSLGFLRYVFASGVLVVVALLTRMKLPAKKDVPWLVARAASAFSYI
jgi:drug/metabolite transporter (DMT)-like permease